MPELPEVESVRRGLEGFLPGCTFEAVEVLHPRANRGQDGDLAHLLVGRGIAGVGRRGKFMWLELDGEDPADPDRDVVHIHLGMSGQVRIGHVESRHVRLRALLSPPPGKGEELVVSFVDQRTFGYWLYAPWSAIGHVAPDPFEPEFDPVSVARRIRAKRTPAKVALLDQTVVSGIGNIYADEAFWAARINPHRQANRLLQREARALVDAAAEVMSAAIDVGGTSFDALYVNVNGESGYFARSLHAYGRTDLPCDRCGALLQRSVIGGRSTHWCPQCQH